MMFHQHIDDQYLSKRKDEFLDKLGLTRSALDGSMIEGKAHKEFYHT